MNKIKKINNDEVSIVELINLFKIIWNGRWKIVVIILLIGFIMFGYQGYKNINHSKQFNVLSTINPINREEIDKYLELTSAFQDSISDSNEILSNITQATLYSLYVETLIEKKTFEDAIDRFGLVNDGNFSNEVEYLKKVRQLALSVNIFFSNAVNKNLNPNNFTSLINNRENQPTGFNEASIQFSYNDEKKWIQVLSFVDKSTNQIVREYLKDSYEAAISLERKKIKFELEDIALRIENLKNDYEIETSNRIAYLKEQATIARTLDIQKNTRQLPTFETPSGLFSSIIDKPYYLKGYDVIEKEIELIQNRTYKDAFIEGMHDLQKEKRSFEQDIRFERLEIFFNSSPLVKNDDFKAASIDISTSKFKYGQHTKFSTLLIQVILSGLIIGALYVVIFNNIQSKNLFRK